MNFTEHDFTLFEKQLESEFAPVVEETAIEQPPKKREVKAAEKKNLNDRVTELVSEIEETQTQTKGTTMKKTDAVAKKVLRRLRRHFVDDFTAKLGKNKDRWAPERWEEQAREYLDAELQIAAPSSLELAKTILVLRSVQAKNNEKTSPVVKRHLGQILEPFCIVFDTGIIELVKNFLADTLGQRLYRNFLTSETYQMLLRELSPEERATWANMRQRLE